MDKPLISDIPTIKKNVENIRTMAMLKKVMPFLRPFLKVLGAKTNEIDQALANVDDLVRQANELVQIPDQFNSLFASRGWIIYDSMNVEVAKMAVDKANAGDIDGAEADLVNYYNVETVRWLLRMMNGVEAFRPRMHLAQKALIDYEEKRFHACIPVILALLDGMVNELHEKRKGFFAEGVNLEAWDSISAHSRGLNVLTEIFQKGRRKTTTEQINIPYRNGILHGMDLGYDNQIVAAKTWAALFATRDWAIKAEKGLITEPPEKPQKTWSEIFQQLRENSAEKELLEQWQPRSLVIGVDIPKTGDADVFTLATPERRLAEYLKYWNEKNYGYMAKYLSPHYRSFAGKKAPALIREVFETKKLISFEFTDLSDDAPAITEIQTKLVFLEYDREVETIHKFRLINEDLEGNPAVRNKQGTDWNILNWEVY